MSIFVLASVYVIAILSFYTLGGGIARLSKSHFSSRELQAFFQLFIGVVVAATLYAIGHTNGKSFSMLLIVVGTLAWGYYYVVHKPGQNNIEVAVSHYFDIRYISVLAGLGVAVLILRYWVGTANLPDPYFWTFRDDVFYSQVAGFLNDTGKESYLIDWINHTDQINTGPYHYSEIWLTALIGRMTGILNLPLYSFVVITLLFSLMYAGVLALCRELMEEKSAIYIWGVGGLIFWMGPILFGLQGTFGPDSFRLYNSPKHILPFCTIVWAYVAFRKGEWTLFTLSLFALPVFNYAFLPVVLVTIPVAWIFYLVFRPGIYRPEWRWLLPFILIYAGTLYGVLRGDSEIRGLVDLTPADLQHYYQMGAQAFKSTLHFGILMLIEALDYVLLFLLALAILEGREGLMEWKKYLDEGVFVLLLLAAISGSAILNFAMDTIQLFSGAFIILMYLVIGVVFSKIFRHPKVYPLKMLAVLASVYFLYMSTLGFDSGTTRLSRYSETYLNQLQENVSALQGQGARFLPTDDSYYESVYNINPNCNFEGYALSFLRDNLVIHTLSILEIQDQETFLDYFNTNRDRILKSVYFVRYVRNLKSEPGNSLSMLELQIRFLQTEKIGFVLSSDADLVPLEIQQLFEKTIHDPTSGETIFFGANYL